MYAGVNTNINDADEIIERTFSFTTKPRWREIRSGNAGTECVRFDSGDNYFKRLSCDGSNSTYFTYNPATQVMYNRDGYDCIGGAGGARDRISKVSCPASPVKWRIVDEGGGNEIRVRWINGSRLWCNYTVGTDRYVTYSDGACFDNDETLSWGSEQ